MIFGAKGLFHVLQVEYARMIGDQAQKEGSEVWDQSWGFMTSPRLKGRVRSLPHQ